MFKNTRKPVEGLSESHWYGIFQLGTSHFDDMRKLTSFLPESLYQHFEMLNQFQMSVIESNVDGGGISIVGRLRAVDMIVRRTVLILSALMPHQFQCPVGNHFIDIHVRGSTRASLNHIYGELFVMLSFKYFFTSSQDSIRLFFG